MPTLFNNVTSRFYENDAQALMALNKDAMSHLDDKMLAGIAKFLSFDAKIRVK